MHPKARKGLIAAIITGVIFLTCLASITVMSVSELEGNNWLKIALGVIAFISVIAFAASIDQFRKYKRY